MKKSLFMMGVAIAALSSCTQNEVLDIAESNTIQFGKSYIGKPTRANIINNEKELDNFYVYASTSSDSWATADNTSVLFTNENVYRGPEGWGYDNIKKYNNILAYSFAAYSDGGKGTITGELSNVEFKAPTAEAGETATSAQLLIKDYRTNEKDYDLLVAIAQNTLSEDNQQVQFSFKHALSQVKFNLHNPLGNNPIKIESFTVEGFSDNATLTYSEPAAGAPNIAWSDFAGSDNTKTINTLERNESLTNNPAYGTYTVIPQTLVGGLTVKITATLFDKAGNVLEQSKQYTASLTNLPEFKAGYIYNFNATLNMGYIHFDVVKVEEWLTDTNENSDTTDDDIEVPTL